VNHSTFHELPPVDAYEDLSEGFSSHIDPPRDEGKPGADKPSFATSTSPFWRINASSDWDEAQLPQREWIVPQYVMRRKVTGLIGAPEAGKAATIYAVIEALKMRDALAEGIDTKLADLLADLRKFDALSLEIRGAACRYGRHETIAFFTPKAADELLFDRLVAMQSLPVMVGDGHIGGRSTISDISREAGARMFGHLAELLPPEERPAAAASKVSPPKKDRRKAKPARADEDDVVDDLPPLEDI
jgi:hypothetical protein